MIDQRTKTVFEFRGLAVFRLVTKNVDRRIHSEKKYYKAETWCRRRAQSCPLVYGPFRLNRVQLLKTSSPQTWSNLQVWSFVRLHKRPQYHGIHWHTHTLPSKRERSIANSGVRALRGENMNWYGLHLNRKYGRKSKHTPWLTGHTHTHWHTLSDSDWHTHTDTYTRTHWHIGSRHRHRHTQTHSHTPQLNNQSLKRS